MIIKELLGIFAIGLTFIAFYPYICSIKKGETKAHVFSWIIWSSVTIVVFFAQLSDEGGAGAWPIGVSGLITLYVAFLAYKNKSDASIKPIDWGFLLLAFTSLPVWYATSDALLAVIILTSVDLLGFGPTFRKAYASPYEEALSFYTLITIRNIISIMALEHYSLTTVLFPLLTAFACALFISMVLLRRRALSI